MSDPARLDDGYATWSHGYDEGRRHGHKECRDEIIRVRAENVHLRALLAADGRSAASPEGLDPDAPKPEGGTT